MKRKKLQQDLLGWYKKSARELPWRKTKDPYAIWVSEIMCQQTRVSTVIPYYERFLTALPTVQALAEATEDDMHRLWKGLGYYRRAALLQKGARQVLERHRGKVPSEIVLLREIAGFGDYTAGAVGSIAFDIPEPAVDGNVVRVFSRWLNDATPGDLLRKRLHEKEARECIAHADPGAWNQALMELGATICLPKSPRCNACPVVNHCAAFAAGTVNTLPVKGKVTENKALEIRVIVHRRGHEVWLEKRLATGLLAGMWGFPIHESAERKPPRGAKETLRYQHVFTHRTWNASVVETTGAPPTGATGRWITFRELTDEPIPTAFQPVVRYLTSGDLFSGLPVKRRGR